MKVKNNLAARIEEQRQIAFEIGWGFGWQQAMDFIAMALNDGDLMGKSVMSGERIDRILLHVQQLQKVYATAFKPKEPEADYYQEQLDTYQRRIYKDKFQPFRERYPELKEIKY